MYLICFAAGSMVMPLAAVGQVHRQGSRRSLSQIRGAADLEQWAVYGGASIPRAGRMTSLTLGRGGGRDLLFLTSPPIILVFLTRDSRPLPSITHRVSGATHTHSQTHFGVGQYDSRRLALPPLRLLICCLVLTRERLIHQRSASAAAAAAAEGTELKRVTDSHLATGQISIRVSWSSACELCE